MHMDKRSGFILPATMALIVIAGIMAVGIYHMNGQIIKTTERWKVSDTTFLAAQDALESVKNGVQTNFAQFYRTCGQQNATFQWFDSANNNDQQLSGSYMGYSSSYSVAQITNSTQYPGTSLDVRFVNVSSGASAGWPYRLLTIKVTASSPEGISRAVQETVWFGIDRSRIFNYSYFLNNFGWFFGVNITMNGDIRSNYDIQFKSTSLEMNGVPYAAGRIIMSQNYKVWNFSQYYADSHSTRARPTDPADAFGGAGPSEWPMGYDPSDVIPYAGVPQLEMPYLGDLSTYTNYAAITGGCIHQGTNLITGSFYSFTNVGPSGIAGNADAGSLILEGSAANPLIISGAVVVAGDVIIQGHYTGKGTIYSGRNIHIVNDLVSVAPPAWPKPDPDPVSTAQNNNQKDLLGLAAKGNVILCDYTQSGWRNSFLNYIRPPFTGDYPVDVTDSNIGYCSWYDTTNKTWMFDGNYTDYDGGVKADGTARRYYESSLSDTDFKSLLSGEYYKDSVDKLDAVIYNNHLMSGFWAANLEMNGALVCRDEAIIPRGLSYFNWDIRLGDHSLDSVDNFFFLPMSLASYRTTQWQEVKP